MINFVAINFGENIFYEINFGEISAIHRMEVKPSLTRVNDGVSGSIEGDAFCQISYWDT